MKIKTKLISIISILIFAIVGLGLFSGYIIHSTVDQNQQLRDKMQIQKEITKIQYRITGISNDERALLLTGEDEYAEGMQNKASDIKETIVKIKGLVEEEDYLKNISSIEQSYNQYWDMNQKVILQYQTDHEAARSIHFGEERSLRKEVLDPAINQFVEILQKDVTDLSDTIETKGSWSKMILLFITITATLTGIILSVLLLKSILTPLHLINKQLEEIAHGEADLTRRVQIKGKNEFGQLAQSFNSFVDSLRVIIQQVESSSEQVAASTEELAASTEQSQATSEQVSDSMQKISDSTIHQSDMMDNSLTAINESFQNLIEVTRNTNSAAEVSSKMRNKAEAGEESIKKLLEQMQFINKSVGFANKGVHSLVSSANEIKDISSLITDIAEQTNLLALNAAIEAARAGEHGKGFAVVAEEVRKLADLTSSNASQIQNLVSTIQNESNATVNNISQVQENVASGMILSEETVMNFNEILDLIETVTSKIQEAAGAVQQITAGFEIVQESIEGITTETKNTAAHSESIVAATEEQVAAMEEVSNSTASLSKLAEDLQALVSRFRV